MEGIDWSVIKTAAAYNEAKVVAQILQPMYETRVS
jgi:hypothetical protein